MRPLRRFPAARCRGEGGGKVDRRGTGKGANTAETAVRIGQGDSAEAIFADLSAADLALARSRSHASRHCQDLADDRVRHFLGSLRADVQAGRRVESRDGLRRSDLGQQLLRPAPRAEHPRVEAALRGVWESREDRYSEIRSEETVALPKVEMSYIGG